MLLLVSLGGSISFVDIYEICYHIYIIYVCIVFMHAPSRGIFYFCLSEEQWPFILMFSHATHASSKWWSLFKTCIFFSLFTYIFFFICALRILSCNWNKIRNRKITYLSAKSPEYARNKYFSNMFLFGDVLL